MVAASFHGTLVSIDVNANRIGCIGCIMELQRPRKLLASGWRDHLRNGPHPRARHADTGFGNTVLRVAVGYSCLRLSVAGIKPRRVAIKSQ